jgi:hypothetical protein
LFVARQHVAQAGEFQSAIEFQIVHAWNAEGGVDAIGEHRLDQLTSDGPGAALCS